MLAQLTFYLTELFVSRWNKEQRGEQDTPPDRRISVAVKQRFVLSLRDVTFMGMFGKSIVNAVTANVTTVVAAGDSSQAWERCRPPPARCPSRSGAAGVLRRRIPQQT